MNAFFQKASLALATASLPLATPSLANEPSWPPPSSSQDWVFIPPISEVSEPHTNRQMMDVISIETPIDIAGQCILTPSFQIFSNMTDPNQRAEHQRLILKWAQANSAKVAEFAETLAIATFNVVRGSHSAEDICHNAPEAQQLLINAFTASGRLFTQGLMEAFPDVIKDGTGIHFTITGFTEAPVRTDPTSIANNNLGFSRKLG